ASVERDERGIEPALLGRQAAAAAEREGRLDERVEAECLLELGVVERRGHEGAQPELGADEVEGLAQMARVEEERPERLRVPAVLPEAPTEARRLDDHRIGAREVPLT